MDAAEINHWSPLVLKRDAAWNGIKLAHYKFQAEIYPNTTTRTTSLR